MSNIKVVCKNLNGHPIEFIRKMNELSDEIKVSWNIEGSGSSKRYRIDIFWEDTSLNDKVEEVIDSFSSYFINPDVVEVNVGGYEEKQLANIEGKKKERKRRKDYEITKPVETQTTEFESEVEFKTEEESSEMEIDEKTETEVDFEITEESNFESEIIEAKPSESEIDETTETEVDFDLTEESNSESEIIEEEHSEREIDETTETEVDFEITEESNFESEIIEEEASELEIDETTETEVDFDLTEESNSESEIIEEVPSKIEITENHGSFKSNEVGESLHLENANEPQQVICEKADIEESKKAFLDLISSKLSYDAGKVTLETLCADLHIDSDFLKKGIKHSWNNKQVKNLNDLFKQVATDMRKNPKIVEFTMKADLKKWVSTYPDDTLKKFTLTLQDFFNLFRRGLKKF